MQIIPADLGRADKGFLTAANGGKYADSTPVLQHRPHVRVYPVEKYQFGFFGGYVQLLQQIADRDSVFDFHYAIFLPDLVRQVARQGGVQIDLHFHLQLPL